MTPPEGVLDADFLAAERQRILDLITPRISLATDRPLMIQWGAVQPMKEELALRLTSASPASIRARSRSIRISFPTTRSIRPS